MIAAFAALALAQSEPLPSSAPPSPPESQELGRVKKELSETRRQIEDYRRLQQSLSQDLKILETQGVDSRRKLQELQDNARKSQRKKDELESRLSILKTASGAWRDELVGELRGYAIWSASRERAFRGADVWTEAYRLAAIAEKTRLLAGLQGVSRRTEADQARTGAKAREFMSQSQKVLAESRRREQEYESKKAAYAQTQESLAAATRRAKELEESAKALTKLMSELQKTSAERKKGQAPGPWQLSPHSLPWPIDGQIIGSFGRQRNASLNTWVIHQGIRLQGKTAAPVQAVSEGRVIFSGPFRSYGRVIILDHGSSFYSIYGELGEIVKGKGDAVAAGETIAMTGTAKSGEDVVYLEIRRGSEALDPLLWLKKK